MKKIFVLLLALALCMGMTSCGSNDSGDKANGGSEGKTEDKKLEKNIDVVAQELGLGDGEETMYQLIGADAGKQYKDGEVELYMFDETSDEYKAAIGGEGSLKASASNDGMVIVTEDRNLIEKFNSIKFK